MKKIIALSTFFAATLFAVPIDTFYGPLEVEEPLLLELIESPPMKRLKHLHQYGVSYFTTHREEYDRFDHSLGVFAILRLKGAPLEEQVAGLLHDASHTTFSHVGDFLFREGDLPHDGYQDAVHDEFLSRFGVGDILARHDLTIDQVSPHRATFTALEQPLPNLCADRIDYNLQGAYHRGFLTREEAQELLADLTFRDGKWVSTRFDLMKKMVRFSLFMTQDCWGSPGNYLASRWLAEAIWEAYQQGEIAEEEILFGTDALLWDKLCCSSHPSIAALMEKVKGAEELFELVEEGEDFDVSLKFRGFDPWMEKEGQIGRLTSFDPEMAREYQEVKERMAKGWKIKLKESPASRTKR